MKATLLLFTLNTDVTNKPHNTTHNTAVERAEADKRKQHLTPLNSKHTHQPSIPPRETEIDPNKDKKKKEHMAERKYTDRNKGIERKNNTGNAHWTSFHWKTSQMLRRINEINKERKNVEEKIREQDTGKEVHRRPKTKINSKNERNNVSCNPSFRKHKIQHTNPKHRILTGMPLPLQKRKPKIDHGIY